MNASEIIEQIKALPPDQRAEVVKFVLESAKDALAEAPARPDWDRIMTEIFDEHDELFRKLAQ